MRPSFPPVAGRHIRWAIVVASLLITACSDRNPAPPKVAVTPTSFHPDWSKNAVIYEVNVRQYTKEGTFKAFQQHLPRLKALGVDILWLMPIHPIGAEHRKGTLGSYYSVKDYTGVNPEFGTMADLKAL